MALMSSSTDVVYGAPSPRGEECAIPRMASADACWNVMVRGPRPAAIRHSKASANRPPPDAHPSRPQGPYRPGTGPAGVMGGQVTIDPSGRDHPRHWWIA